MNGLPQTATDLFDTLLPLGIAAYPEKVKSINAIFGFKLEGEGGGYWVLDCTSSPPKISKDGPQAQCVIELEHEDFKKLMADHNVGMDLYFANKIRVTGESLLALKLGLFFEITLPKPGL